MLRTSPISFTPTVGVAPGTTTMRLGLAAPRMRVLSPYQRDFWELRGGLGAIDTRAHIRWDILGLVGGGSLIIAMMTGLVAAAIGNIKNR